MQAKHKQDTERIEAIKGQRWVPGRVRFPSSQGRIRQLLQGRHATPPLPAATQALPLRPRVQQLGGPEPTHPAAACGLG